MEKINPKDIKIIVTDVDGVIFDVSSSWREFHKQLGTYDENRLETLRKSYLKGRITYLQWAEEEVKVWKGLPYKKFCEIVENFPYVKGAEETVKKLKEVGYYLVAISSGGLSRPVEKRLKWLGYDEVYSNDLEEVGSILTGNFILKVEHHNKHDVLQKILEKNNYTWEECAAVGDDITDITLLRKCGLTIAFCPKEIKLIKAADYTIQKKDLREILRYLL